MKYSNSLKYMNSFPWAISSSDTSGKRLRTLCQRLGRVELGSKYICMPGGSAGYASAVMLASVIKNAGYSVGLITSAFGYDSRLSVSINGEMASIEDYNNSVAELKGAVGRLGTEEYYREEAVFALGLLLCKLSGCEYVILQGISDNSCTLDAICAPYDLIVIPTVYGSERSAERVKLLCDLIRRGAREVISGNQKSEIYNTISNACAVSGARLDIPLKAQFEVTALSAMSSEFTYGDRDGFTLRSPSILLRDLAMTVIEASLALRRGGVKLPWSSICQGMSAATGTGCFELLSVSPLMIVDSASDAIEVEMLARTVGEVFGEDAIGSMSVCIPESAKDALSAFEGKEIDEIVMLSENESEGLSRGEIRLDSTKRCAKEVVRLMKSGKNILCFGSVAFVRELQTEFFKLI